MKNNWLKVSLIIGSLLFYNKSFALFLEPSQSLLKSKNNSFIDIRSFEDYKKSHIPTAINIPSDTFQDILNPDNLNNFTQTLSALGVSNKNNAIIYAGSEKYDIVKIGVLSFFLDYVGFKKISILNGGIENWQKKGILLSKDSFSITPTQNKWMPKKNIFIDMSSAKKIKNNAVFVDVRKPGEFFKYHVKSSKNMTASFFLDNKTLKSKAEISKLLNDMDIARKKVIILFPENRADTFFLSFMLRRYVGFGSVKILSASDKQWQLLLPMEKNRW